MRFKWIDWNREHIARHGVKESEAAQVVLSPRSVHQAHRDGTVVTRGRTAAGRRLHVVWREEDATDILADLESWVFIITAYEA